MNPISSPSNHTSQTKVLGDKEKEGGEPENSRGKEGGGVWWENRLRRGLILKKKV